MKDDIFDKLNESLLPSLKRLEELHKELGEKIQRGIIEDMMSARTIAELDEIRWSNDLYFDEWPILSSHYDRALNRIKNVFKVYKDLMGLEMLN